MSASKEVAQLSFLNEFFVTIFVVMLKKSAKFCVFTNLTLFWDLKKVHIYLSVTHRKKQLGAETRPRTVVTRWCWWWELSVGRAGAAIGARRQNGQWGCCRWCGWCWLWCKEDTPGGRRLADQGRVRGQGDGLLLGGRGQFGLFDRALAAVGGRRRGERGKGGGRVATAEGSPTGRRWWRRRRLVLIGFAQILTGIWIWRDHNYGISASGRRGGLGTRCIGWCMWDRRARLFWKDAAKLYTN